MAWSTKRAWALTAGLSGAVLLITVVVVAMWIVPNGATRPCEQTFADRLAQSPLVGPGPDGTETDDGSPAGVCGDDDDGGVSSAEADYVSRTLTAPEVLAAYRAGARQAGFTVTDRRPGFVDLCAHRQLDGHRVELLLQFDDTPTAEDGIRDYTVSLIGDSGDPMC